MRSNRQVQTAANAQHPMNRYGPGATMATGLSPARLARGARAPHSAAPMNALRAVPALLLALALAAGCSTPAPPRAPAVAADQRSQALIDSGNVAYRAGDFEDAARRYASAAVAKPDDPAAYYGLGMALAKLGRDDEAREAYGRARSLAGAAAADTAAHR